MKNTSKILFGFVLALCLVQALKCGDFIGYLVYIRHCLQEGFHTSPYPVLSATNGDYFQSPVITILLIPFSYLPTAVAKAIWGFINFLGVLYIVRKFVKVPLNAKQTLFLLFIFSHPLSDVFLSGNLNFPMLVLLVSGWSLLGSQVRRKQWLGGQCIAIAVFIKAAPILFFFWFLLTAQWRKALALLSGVVAGVFVTYVFLPAGGFLTWWKAWFHALSIYYQAANPGAAAFQSPPAALYRFMINFGLFSESTKMFIVQVFAMAVIAAIFSLCLYFYYRRIESRYLILPFLLSTFFIGGPHSWASTVLYIFPIVYLYTVSGISKTAAVVATISALLPKALWPVDAWHHMIQWNLPASLLLILIIITYVRLLRDADLQS